MPESRELSWVQQQLPTRRWLKQQQKLWPLPLVLIIVPEKLPFTDGRKILEYN